MKKKLWALMMAAAVTVSAVGCGNGKGGSDTRTGESGKG